MTTFRQVKVWGFHLLDGACPGPCPQGRFTIPLSLSSRRRARRDEPLAIGMVRVATRCPSGPLDRPSRDTLAAWQVKAPKFGGKIKWSES